MTTAIDSETAVIDGLRALPTRERLRKLCDAGILATAERVGDQVEAVIHELIALLDFERADIARGFFILYAHCLDLCRVGEFDRIAIVFGHLRTSAGTASRV